MWILFDIQIEKDPFSSDLLTLAHIHIDVTREHSSRMCTTHFPSWGVGEWTDIPGCNPLPDWIQTPLLDVLDANPHGGKPCQRQTPTPWRQTPPPEPGLVTCDACWEANPLNNMTDSY